MLEWFLELVNKFADTLIKILPASPFQKYISSFSNLPYLGYLNWFIPVRACIVIGTSWLAVIGIFYIYSIIMRWVKMIGD